MKKNYVVFFLLVWQILKSFAGTKVELKPLFSEECVFNIDILMRKVKPIIYPYAYIYYTT